MTRWILAGRMPVFFIVAAYLCGLQWPVLLVVSLISVGMVPFLLWKERKEQEHEKRLEDGAFYMEQLIYSFRKHHKILSALKDVSRLTDGEMQFCLSSAISRLEVSMSEDDMFQQAFACIEQEYGHPLMQLLHAFLIRVEEQGGDCTMALGLLLNQLRNWKKNQKAFASRKKSIQSRLVLSVILSCVICLAVVRMMPGTEVTELIAYQVCTGIGLVLFQLLYVLFCGMLSGVGMEKTGLQKQEKESSRVDKLYERMASPMHGLRYWSTVRKLEKEIRIYFPEWMFGMILRLQTENVQTAIARSLDDAPEVLVPPLYQLIRQQQEDPVSIQPYLDFLKEYDLPEIHGIMLQLYAINDMGREEIQEQIYAMLDQNQRLSEVAAEIQMDSVLSWMGMLAAVPMFLSVIVLVVDMSLMLLSFLGGLYHV